MKFKEIKKNLLEGNSYFRETYSKRSLAIEIAHKVIEERVKQRLTQKNLARMSKTQQPAIARLERGTVVPSLKSLEKIAVALGKKLVIDFVDTETRTYSPSSQHLYKLSVMRTPIVKEESLFEFRSETIESKK